MTASAAGAHRAALDAGFVIHFAEGLHTPALRQAPNRAQCTLQVRARAPFLRVAEHGVDALQGLELLVCALLARTTGART
jgi:hypothetical protein